MAAHTAISERRHLALVCNQASLSAAYARAAA
jgi:hypothetical protein